MLRILPRFFCAACLVLVFSGCASSPDDDDPTKGKTAEQIFAEAKEMQADARYETSNKLFEKLEARFPYGRHAQQSQLEIGYNYFKDSEPELAIASVERFMRQNPAHVNMDYAYYLRGLISFSETQGFLSRLVQQDMSERDPKNARESFEAFKTLVNRFPNSKYAPDAHQRLAYLVGALAAHELHVARYYYKRGAFLAAANRGKYLLENFSETKWTEGALGIMVMSYDKLGIIELRDDAKRILTKNYPDSKSMSEDFLSDPWWWAPI